MRAPPAWVQVAVTAVATWVSKIEGRRDRRIKR
jgi:hypothetical protein